LRYKVKAACSRLRQGRRRRGRWRAAGALGRRGGADQPPAPRAGRRSRPGMSLPGRQPHRAKSLAVEAAPDHAEGRSRRTDGGERSVAGRSDVALDGSVRLRRTSWPRAPRQGPAW